MKPASSKTKQEIVLQEENYTTESTQYDRFSDFIKDMRKGVVSQFGKQGITTRELAELVGIDYEQFRKIVNMNKPTKKRDCIIAICAVLRLDLDETNEALVLYNHMPTLDEDTINKRDLKLIEILDEQFINPLTIAKINQRLVLNGFPELDIIDHRRSVKPAPGKVNAPYKLLKKRVRTLSNDLLLFGNQYDSLDAEYSMDRYRCVAEMWLDDAKQKQIYHLTADTHHSYDIEVHGETITDIKSYTAPEDSGVFMDYFFELEAMANRELKKMLSILNDTKNYNTRISAGILDGALHVYVETYNFTVPELNEYYLFEYKNGSALLSVYQDSEFMRCYLSPDQYTQTYGKKPITLIAQYNSVEEITSCHNLADRSSPELLKCRSSYFKMLKDKADTLISDIKSGKKYIRHLDYIYDDRDRVCEFFGVEKEFECSLDDEYGDMMFAGKKSADFQFEGSDTVIITIEDLYKAFELGFTNIREICRVKQKLGSIEDILK